MSSGQDRFLALLNYSSCNCLYRKDLHKACTRQASNSPAWRVGEHINPLTPSREAMANRWILGKGDSVVRVWPLVNLPWSSGWPHTCEYVGSTKWIPGLWRRGGGKKRRTKFGVNKSGGGSESTRGKDWGAFDQNMLYTRITSQRINKNSIFKGKYSLETKTKSANLKANKIHRKARSWPMFD